MAKVVAERAVVAVVAVVARVAGVAPVAMVVPGDLQAVVELVFSF